MQQENEFENAHPTSLSHIVGQRNTVEQLRLAIDAACNQHQRLDDCLFVGPSGLGKSEIVRVTACELATECHFVLGQSLKKLADMNHLLMSVKDKELVFIDECHELKKPLQTLLFHAIDQRAIIVIGEASEHRIPLAQFTLMLATTDEHALVLPLRNRMKITLQLQYYTVDELLKIVTWRSKMLRWNLEDEVALQIAKRSKGVPRDSMKLLLSCRRIACAWGDKQMTIAHFNKACALEELDDYGLTAKDRKYLDMVARGTNQLNVLASKLGDDPRTVSKIIESTLIRLGFLVKDDRGRRLLTALGREHWEKTCQIGVQFV